MLVRLRQPAQRGGASNREELKAKDAPLAALLTEVYGDTPWRYVKTEQAHRRRPTSPTWRAWIAPLIPSSASTIRRASRPRPKRTAAGQAPIAADSSAIEQTERERPPAEIVASFDGLGRGF